MLERNKTDWTALALVALYSLAALLLVSWDGYLYDAWPHYDVNWFYTCGKAWMNGMTPYVDFADSKGPLLWLIYGVGYLMSPHDYLGLFWLSVALYTFIFYYCYKCARLFGLHRWPSLAVVAVVSVFMLSGLAHEEVKAEDYCNALLAPVIYHFLQFTVARRNSERLATRAALTLGFALGASFLIKYSCTLMMLAWVPWMGWVMPRRCHCSVARTWLTGVAGAALALVPMALVLLAQGCLDDFLHEYIGVTFATFGNMAGHSLTVDKAWSILTQWQMLLYLAGLAASIVLYGLHVRHGRWQVAAAAVWYLAVTLLNAAGRPYFNTLSTFSWYGVPVLALLLARLLSRPWTVLPVAAASLAALLLTVNHVSNITALSLELTVQHYYAGLMKQYDHPRVLYLQAHDRGFGVQSEALPACKYWSLQEGYTQEMVDDQIQAVRQHRADVVFVKDTNEPMLQLLQAEGYHTYDFTDAGLGEKQWHRNLLCSRKPLRHTHLVPRLTTVDVALKRPATTFDTITTP